jgi:hypothetical protein
VIRLVDWIVTGSRLRCPDVGRHEVRQLGASDNHQRRHLVNVYAESDRDDVISQVLVTQTNGDGVKFGQLLYCDESVHVEEAKTPDAPCRQ